MVVWSKVYETFRKAVIVGRLLRVTGRIEREGQVIHVITERIEDLSPMLATLGRPSRPDVNGGNSDGPVAPESKSSRSFARHPSEQAKKLFPSRDFY